MHTEFDSNKTKPTSVTEVYRLSGQRTLILSMRFLRKTSDAITAKPAFAPWVTLTAAYMPWCLLKPLKAFESSVFARPISVRFYFMNKKSNPNLIDTDNPEWTAQDIKTAVPFSSLPATLRTKLGGRGPQKAPAKVSTTIRLSPDVVQAFRAAGDGWQTRIDAALKDWLRTHSPV